MIHARSNEALVAINNSYAAIDPDVERLDDSNLSALI